MLSSAVGQAYVDAIVAAGGAPVCIPLGLEADALVRLYRLLNGLLLPGGCDVAPERYGEVRHEALGIVDEQRDELELTLGAWALRDDLPLLGICRGAQVLAVVAGGTLYQDLPSDLPSPVRHEVPDYGRDYLIHDIAVESGTHLRKAIGRDVSRVNSLHHQSIRDVPSDFIVSARAPDGVIEGIEATGRRFAVGVQSHPEALWKTTACEYAGLFSALIRFANERTAVEI